MESMASLSSTPLAPRRALGAPAVLGFSVAVSLLVAYAPYGRVVGYPLAIFASLVHEMGHGLAALLVGGSFDSFELWSDGSGMAHASGYSGRLAQAIVSAGGLCGPACAAALCFLLARGPRRARAALLASGAALLLADVLLVRTLFGLVFVGLLALLLLAVGRFGSGEHAQLALGFLAVQLGMSVFADSGYLFTPVAHTGAGLTPSDVANMSSALLLPYWFWGAACGAFSLAVLAGGAWLFLRPARAGARA
jgi:hypothetical protein